MAGGDPLPTMRNVSINHNPVDDSKTHELFKTDNALSTLIYIKELTMILIPFFSVDLKKCISA